MSEKKRRGGRTCDMCARITERDMSRRFCPVSACMIYRGRPADSCKLFAMDEEYVPSGASGKRRRRDVR